MGYDGKGKIAYCVIPESGGLFRFYLNLRRALSPLGWELFAPCVGPSAKKRWDAAFADESCHLIAPDEQDPRKAAQALTEWIENNGINVLMPMDSSVAASSLPHLNPNVKLVTRCSNLSDFGFRISLLCPERLCRTVVMTPAMGDRVRSYSGSEGKVLLIPHGVDHDAIRGVSGKDEDVFRLLYLGRLEEAQKGIFYLPVILSLLVKAGVDFEMDILGDGVDRNRLESCFVKRGVKDRVNMIGTLSNEQVREQLNAVHYDVLIMPSRYEGFPNALLEAMAAGIVPVVSRIEGISDFVVENKVNGMLCGIGRTKEFAAAIEYLAADRNRCREMSRKVRQVVEDCFSLTRMGDDYDKLFGDVLSEKSEYTPVVWSDFEVDRNYRPSWRKYLPQWVKNLVRRYIRI